MIHKLVKSNMKVVSTFKLKFSKEMGITEKVKIWWPIVTNWVIHSRWPHYRKNASHMEKRIWSGHFTVSLIRPLPFWSKDSSQATTKHFSQSVAPLSIYFSTQVKSIYGPLSGPKDRQLIISYWCNTLKQMWSSSGGGDV